MNSLPSPLHIQAWRRIFHARTCPPAGVLKAGGDLVERHLNSCAECRQALELAGGLAGAGALLAKIPATPRPATPPAPGDIRRVRPAGDSSSWFDATGRYHNPPLVLVLTSPDSWGFVRVAQCFDEPDLCDLGDVELGDGGRTIAEAWNVYGLPASGLAPRAYRRVDPAYAAQVLELGGIDYPAISPASALYHFRRCEAETGAFFSMALNAEALARIEAAEEAAETAEAAEAQAKPGLAEQLAGRIKRFRDLLEQWLFPDWTRFATPLPATAADEHIARDIEEDKAPLRAPCLVAAEGASLDAPRTIPAEVHLLNRPDGFLCTAYCRVEEDLPLAEAGAACGQALPDEGLVRAKKVEDRVFRIHASFTGQDLNPDELRFTLLLYGNGETKQ